MALEVHKFMMRMTLSSETIQLPASRLREAPHLMKPKSGSIFQQRPWKRHQSVSSLFEKLLIPLPVPHPANIAILIYNRDSEQPIPLDNDISTEILKSIEDCQKQLNVSAIGKWCMNVECCDRILKTISLSSLDVPHCAEIPGRNG